MRRHVFKNLALALTASALSACSQAPVEPNITIANASIRMPLPGQSTAAAYFDIVNTGAKDVLLNATTSLSDKVELHNHLHENGVMTMRRVESVTIPAQQTTAFKSGGLHVMMFEADMVRADEFVPLTLSFEKTGDVTIKIEIGQTAPSGHNH